MKLKVFAAGLVTATLLIGTASAQQFFRIGTGGTAGTYYPVGGMIANAVSQPGKIIVTAQASNGSLGNVNGVAGGAMEGGFSQSDVATWAQTGTGIFEGKPKVAGLRMIANLYPESIHVVVKKGSGFKSIADLKGNLVKRLDELASFRDSLFDPKPIEVKAPKIQADPELLQRLTKPKAVDYVVPANSGGNVISNRRLRRRRGVYG